MTAPMMAKEELPILDRLARLEQAHTEEIQRRQEFEAMTLDRLNRLERAIGIDTSPRLVRGG